MKNNSPEQSLFDGRKSPKIRVTAHISENVLNLNENCVLEHFKNAILQDLGGKEFGSMNTVSSDSDANLQQQLLGVQLERRVFFIQFRTFISKKWLLT